MGNEAWTEALEWPGAMLFHAAPQKTFEIKSNGKVGGVYKGAEGLTFMRVTVLRKSLSNSQVFGAGHMYTKPRFCLLTAGFLTISQKIRSRCSMHGFQGSSDHMILFH